MLNEPSQAQPSGWAELPPVAAEITSPMLFVDAFDDTSPRTLDSIPPVEGSEIIPHEIAKVLAQEVKEWDKRAANVQATALFMSAVDTLVWMSMNVYSFLESLNPGSEDSYMSHGAHTVTTAVMSICGVVMICTAAAAANYRSRAWNIGRRLEGAIIIPETDEA